MGLDPDRFPDLGTKRRAAREADERDRAGIAAYATAAAAAHDAATSSATAADAAHHLAAALGGPVRAGAGALAADQLADAAHHLAAAFTALGAQLGCLADLARDAHLAHLRTRLGTVPADYIHDLLGAAPDHPAPGHAAHCPGYVWHAAHATCPPSPDAVPLAPHTLD